jgi:hypothetical protein
MLSKTCTVVLAAALSAAPTAHTFAIGDSQSEAASPHTAFPAGMNNSGARYGITDSVFKDSSNNSTHRSRRNGEQVGDFERSDRVATN